MGKLLAILISISLLAPVLGAWTAACSSCDSAMISEEATIDFVETDEKYSISNAVALLEDDIVEGGLHIELLSRNHFLMFHDPEPSLIFSHREGLLLPPEPASV